MESMKATEIVESFEAVMAAKKKKNTKRLIASAVALAITTVIIFASNSVAYFTDGGDIKPIIVLSGANLSGELVEITVPSEGAKPIVGPTNLKIVPGARIEKSISVKNTGDMGMYIRVLVEKDFILSAENEGKSVDPSLIKFEINSDYWEERDGFYYYKTPLLHGEVTESLFEEIEFSPYMDNTYTNSSISFNVKAYATPSHENGSSVFEAQGWPEVRDEWGGSR